MTVTLKFLSIGECMGELSPKGSDLYRFGFAGDTLNTAWYMRALTDETQFAVDYLTAIGSDPLSAGMLDFFAANGIGTKAILRTPERTIGLYLISLNNGERTFTYWRDSSAARLLASDEAHLHSHIAAADCIYFSGITLAILNPDQRQRLFAELARARSDGKIIAFDSNLRRKLWQSESEMLEVLTAAYNVTTIALPTFDDDRQVFGDNSPDACAARIADCGVVEIVVKNGAGPSFTSSAGVTTWVVPEPVTKVVDTTGAGDSFNAGYLAARLYGRLPDSAAATAHRVAGRVVSHPGALMDMHLLADLRLSGRPEIF